MATEVYIGLIAFVVLIGLWIFLPKGEQLEG